MRKRFGVLKGFTLVELLVVMSIMAILMTIVIIGTQTVRLRGRDAKRKTDLSKVQSSLAIFYADKKSYPIPYEETDPLPNRPLPEIQIYNGGAVISGSGHPEGGYPNMMSALQTKGYIENYPQDPKNIIINALESYKYRYRPNTSGLGFELSAKLENTHDGELTSDNTGTIGNDSTRYEIGNDKALNTAKPNILGEPSWKYDFTTGIDVNLRFE